MGLEMNPIAQPSRHLGGYSFALRGVGPTEAEVQEFFLSRTRFSMEVG